MILAEAALIRFRIWLYVYCSITANTWCEQNLQCSCFQCLGRNTRRHRKEGEQDDSQNSNTAIHHNKASVCCGLQPPAPYPLHVCVCVFPWTSHSVLALVQAVLSSHGPPLTVSAWGRERKGGGGEGKGGEGKRTHSQHCRSAPGSLCVIVSICVNVCQCVCVCVGPRQIGCSIPSSVNL